MTLYNFYVVFVSTILNRFRGGGIIHHFPVEPRWIVMPLIGIMSYIQGVHSFLIHSLVIHLTFLPFYSTICLVTATPAFAAILYMLCWLVWSILPWGPWISLGNDSYDFVITGSMKTFENFIESISFKNVYIALFWRMLIGLIPMAVFFNPLYLILAPLMVGCYSIGWFIRNHYFNTVDAIAISESLVGSILGIALILFT